MHEVYPEQEFLEYIVKSLSSNKEKVKIVRTVDSIGTLYTISVAKEDVGKIIGKGGETAKAIRTLLGIIAYENGIKASMKIDAPYLNRQQNRGTSNTSH